MTLNGAVVRELGVQADAARDVILVDGARLPPPGPRRTIVLHKPRGIVSTQDDPEGRPTVRTLLGGSERRLYPVGRLDVNTTGLLLMTNDGNLAAALLHPRAGVPRVYRAKVRGAPDDQALVRVRRGVRLEDGKTLPAEVRVLEKRPTKTWLEITVREGRSRLVRRLFDSFRLPSGPLKYYTWMTLPDHDTWYARGLLHRTFREEKTLAALESEPRALADLVKRVGLAPSPPRPAPASPSTPRS